MQESALAQQLHTIESRLDSFLVKLHERSHELLEGFITEAPSVIAGDDRYGQAYYRFLSAMRGQINTIRQKVQEVRENQVLHTFYQYNNTLSFSSTASHQLYSWYQRCLEKISVWEDTLYQHEEQAIAHVEQKDYEPIFEQLLRNYHTAKDNMRCRQCGAPLQISEVFYYSTYVPCPACHTQNIFDPGADARQLEDVARKLAEQRSKHLLDEHHRLQELERTLYMEMHTLQLSLIHEKNTQQVRDAHQRIATLEAERNEAMRKAPQLHEEYYRAVFDELTTLLPDLREHNERFFSSMQQTFLSRKTYQE